MSLHPEEPELVPEDAVFEEEAVPNYTPTLFYPVRLGEVINARYRIICKLGWGGGSTVWLVRDLHATEEVAEYAALKISVKNRASNREVALLHRIAKADPASRGLSYIRVLRDAFNIEGPEGTHSCMVFPPMREPLNVLQRRMKGSCFSFRSVRYYVKVLLLVLSYLHDTCNIVHTDIKPENILVGFEKTYMLSDIEEEERLFPGPRKLLPTRVIYKSLLDFGPPRSIVGTPNLTDFDLAVPISTGGCYFHNIQLNPYRAPEVTLGQAWWYPVDVWSVAVMSWELLENRPLCSGRDKNGQFSSERQIAELVGLLGTPPNGFTMQGQRRRNFFDDHGELLPIIHELIPQTSLEDTISHISGEEKREFLRFMRRILQWAPEDRPTATELLQDPFMTA